MHLGIAGRRYRRVFVSPTVVQRRDQRALGSEVHSEGTNGLWACRKDYLFVARVGKLLTPWRRVQVTDGNTGETQAGIGIFFQQESNSWVYVASIVPNSSADRCGVIRCVCVRARECALLTLQPAPLWVSRG